MRLFIQVLIALSVAAVNVGALAAPIAGGGSNLSGSQQEEFESKAGSIEALLKAFQGMAGPYETEVLRGRVGALMQRASAAYVDGEAALGHSLLEQAMSDVRAAIVHARDGQTLTNQRGEGDQYQVRNPESGLRRAYQTKVESIDALFAAYVRVSQEKNLPGQANLMASHLGELKRRADDALRRGDNDTGLQWLDDAYKLVREGVAALRQGETLVRSLNLGSPEAEYDYYVDKTASQMEAIQIMLDANYGHSRRNLLDALLQGARAQLESAASLAADGKYADALPAMDRVFTRLQTGLMMALSSR